MNETTFPADDPVRLTDEQIAAVAGGGNTIKIVVPTAAAGAAELPGQRPSDGPPGGLGDRTS